MPTYLDSWTIEQRKKQAVVLAEELRNLLRFGEENNWNYGGSMHSGRMTGILGFSAFLLENLPMGDVPEPGPDYASPTEELLCDYCESCGEKRHANCHDPLWCDGELCEFVSEDSSDAT